MQSLKTLANVLFPLSNPFLLEEGARHADGLLPWCRALSVQQGVADFPLFVDDKGSEAAIRFYLSLYLLLTQDHRCFYLPTEKHPLVGVEPWAVFDIRAISFTRDLELRSAIAESQKLPCDHRMGLGQDCPSRNTVSWRSLRMRFNLSVAKINADL